MAQEPGRARRRRSRAAHCPGARGHRPWAPKIHAPRPWQGRGAQRLDLAAAGVAEAKIRRTMGQAFSRDRGPAPGAYQLADVLKTRDARAGAGFVSGQLQENGASGHHETSWRQTAAGGLCNSARATFDTALLHTVVYATDAGGIPVDRHCSAALPLAQQRESNPLAPKRSPCGKSNGHMFAFYTAEGRGGVRCAPRTLARALAVIPQEPAPCRRLTRSGDWVGPAVGRPRRGAAPAADRKLQHPWAELAQRRRRKATTKATCAHAAGMLCVAPKPPSAGVPPMPAPSTPHRHADRRRGRRREDLLPAPGDEGRDEPYWNDHRN